MEIGRRRIVRAPLFLPPLVLASFLGVAACSSHEAWFPLKEGERLTFLVKTATTTRPVVVHIGKQEQYGELSYFRLSGEGEWLIGWEKDRLMVAEMPSLRLETPFCLLQPSARHKTWGYEGYGYDFEGRVHVQATVSQEPVSLVPNDTKTKREALRVVLHFRIRGGSVEIRTWFERGKGIIRQELWRDKRRVALWERLET